MPQQQQREDQREEQVIGMAYILFVELMFLNPNLESSTHSMKKTWPVGDKDPSTVDHIYAKYLDGSVLTTQEN